MAVELYPSVHLKDGMVPIVLVRDSNAVCVRLHLLEVQALCECDDVFRLLSPPEVLDLCLTPHHCDELTPFRGEVVEVILEGYVGVPEDGVRNLFVVGGIECVTGVLGNVEASARQNGTSWP